KELQLRAQCGKLIERGKVNLNATAEYSDQTAQAASINTALLNKYFAQLLELSESMEVPVDRKVLFEQALHMPEVISHNEDDLDPEEGQVLMDAFAEAFKAFDKFRQDEGAVLSQDLGARAEEILQLLAQVEADEADR